ncbi:MAG: hypothetical protein EU551_00980 [Promethearchaeota archaeon]|nr:MAG: hypothetical protein EU551_00980 [Candidatus Lokiarchaeota archaeon]
MSDDDKKNEKIVTIRIHKEKKMATLKKNEIKDGIIRVRGYLKKDERWTTQAYEIALNNLGVFEGNLKKELMKIFQYPNMITDQETSRLIKKLIDEYGEIKPVNPKKLLFKTDRYKKKFKVKQRRV